MSTTTRNRLALTVVKAGGTDAFPTNEQEARQTVIDSSRPTKPLISGKQNLGVATSHVNHVAQICLFPVPGVCLSVPGRAGYFCLLSVLFSLTGGGLVGRRCQFCVVGKTT